MDINIRYLKRHEIDEKRWDKCISQSTNGSVYPFSFYLDAMATNWDGLILNDYEAVMPLSWRKKWSIFYLYQPFLTAQLGIFGKHLTLPIEESFFSAIPHKFKLWEFPLNAGNKISNDSFIYFRKNYVLPLSLSYEQLYTNYRTQVKRNIKKAVLKTLVVKQGIPFSKVMELAQNNAPINDRERKYLYRFKGVYELLSSTNKAITYGAYAGSILYASAVFLFSHNRAYYILVGNSPEGRTLGASHYLIDAFIKDHAGSGLVLDFEGSDIDSLAFFYSGFGAVEEPYPAVKYNSLPFYLKWLKR